MVQKRYRVSFDLPPREEGEEDATERQIDYLHHLGKFDDAYLRMLGKWQASSLIDQIKDGDFTVVNQVGGSSRFGRFVGIVFLSVVSLGLLGFLIFWSRHPVQKSELIADISIPPSRKPVEIESVEPPATIYSTDEVTLRKVGGGEMTFPRGTKILVDSRKDAGVLLLTIDGIQFASHQGRLKGRIER